MAKTRITRDVPKKPYLSIMALCGEDLYKRTVKQGKIDLESVFRTYKKLKMIHLYSFLSSFSQVHFYFLLYIEKS